MKPFEEDGREFIKAAARRVWGDPFPEFIPKLSKSQVKREKRALVTGEFRSTTSGPGRVPPAPVPQPNSRRHISHFVMNLPDSAIEFMDAFRGILAEPELREAYAGRMPMVHCHCFTKEVDDQTRAETNIKQVSSASVLGRRRTLRRLITALQRVEEKLGHALTEDATFHLVRSVSPGKDMYCISFRLPQGVAFACQ